MWKRIFACAITAALLFFFFQTSDAFAAAAAPVPADSQAPAKPKMVIFLVHGFLGGEITFCDLQKILQEEYGDQVLVENILYDTLAGAERIGDFKFKIHTQVDTANIPNFSVQVSQAMAKYYAVNQLDPETTPYSVIAHSEGGMVTFRYVADCIYNHLSTCAPGSPQNLKEFISIATPFWGSPAASDVKFKDFLKKLVPVRQVKDMSNGSAIVNYNRELSLEPIIKNQGRSLFPASTEVVNISADMSKSFLGKLINIGTETGSNDLLESDLVVPTYSGNIDYHYKIYPKAGGAALEGTTKMADYSYVIPGIHTDLLKNQGVACIYQQDLEGRSYTENTTYLLLRKHLDKMLIPKDVSIVDSLQDLTRFITDLQSFNIEVKLNLPQRSPWFHRILFQDENMIASSDDSKIEDLTRKNSLWMQQYRGFNYDNTDSDLNYVSYFHTAFYNRGNYKVASDFRVDQDQLSQTDFSFDIRIPWFKQARVSAKVSPGYTTFIEYNLEKSDIKFLPVKLSETDSRSLKDGRKVISLRKGINHTLAFVMDTNNGDGEVKRVLFDSKNWQKEIPAVNPASLQRIYDECYIATVSDDQRDENIFYSGFRSQQTADIPLNDNQRWSDYTEEFRVVGRYGEGAFDKTKELYEKDRLLVYSRALESSSSDPRQKLRANNPYERSGYYWIETKNVRLMHPCGYDPQVIEE